MKLKTLYRRQRRYSKMALELSRLGQDPASRFKLGALTFLVIGKSRSRWSDRSVHVRVRGAGEQPLALATRTELEVLREIFIEHEYEIDGSDTQMTIVDLGAHIGLAARFLSTCFPNARIIAVEADPELLPRLRENLHGINAEVIHAVVGAAGQPVRTLYTSGDSWANSIHQALDWQRPIDVPGLGFDELLAQAGVEVVDLLKLDIEGAEWEAFPDGIPDSVDRVIGEVHSTGNEDPVGRITELTGERPFQVRRSHAKRATFIAERQFAG